MPVPAPAVRPDADPVSAPTRPAPAESPLRTWMWRLLPPLAAYLASQLVHALAAARMSVPYLTVDSRVRSDSGLYAAVADRGYELFLCRTDPQLAPDFAPDAWCGTAGWFPLYPWLMKAVDAVTGFGATGSGLLVTEVSLLAALVLLWHLLGRLSGGREDGGPGRSLAVLAIAAALPAGIYLHAVFPLAPAAALALGCAALLPARRWLWAGLLGAAVAMSYPVGVVIGAMGAGVLLALWRAGEFGPGRAGARRAGRALLSVTGLPVLGLAGVFLTHHLTVGHWNGYLMIQEHYGNGAGNPFTALFRLLTEPSVVPVDKNLDLIWLLDLATDAELLWALGLVLLAGVLVWHAGRRGRLNALDAGLALYGLAAFLAPLVAGASVSQYRSHVLLLPVLLVLRHLRAWPLWAIAAASALIALPMGVLFFAWLLF